ncbi:tRNA dihydrouridine synthase DusB [Ruminococcaceae bacterium OttesenSCG-928-O06]|nr:tRNA dihydrouridine synthase DusB [Ruminococcaceae bacterium OttesenSCG-928-O06]
MQIGSIPLATRAALAPMAGISDGPMRALCAAYGAAFTVSEMVSAQAVCMGDKKSMALLRKTPAESGTVPYGVQLFGHVPGMLAEAVRRIEEEDFDFLDLNMGCPAPKICGHGAGSALLRDPAAAGAFAAAAVAQSRRPVTAKLRIGWDDATMTGTEVARRCEAAGVQMLVVHGRTRAAQYTPGVNLAAVAEIKAAVKIPVWFNGDVDGPAAALHALAETGCDGVVVGRAALGNPFIFQAITAALAGEALPVPPSLRQRLAVMEGHVRAMCEEKGEERAMREARKVAAGYMKGLKGAASLRRAAHSLTYYADVARLAELAWRYNR